jgi:nitronate monooxygenase
MDPALASSLNLLLESERAGVIALDRLIAEVTHDELRRLLTLSREHEAATAAALENLLGSDGEEPSAKIGPFADKVAVATTLHDRLSLLLRGEEWVARKADEALALAPATGPIHDQLEQMAKRHRFEVEWGRAELIRIMDAIR